MKLVTFRGPGGTLRPGALVDSAIVDLVATDRDLPASIRAILAEDRLPQVEKAVKSSHAVRVAQVDLAAPVPDPGKIICIGLNYRDHAAESAMSVPTEPVVFAKFGSSIVGPDQPIVLPRLSSEVDYEAELVVVIGRRAIDVPEAEAPKYIGGYTLGNDVSARDWQLQKPGGQWILGKSFTSFAPLGPAITTADEIPDPQALDIQFRLNGERLQHSNTSHMIFRVDHLVSYLSRIVPLEPGDLIFTGTPPGVGFARKPPIYLQDGDVCEVEIDKLGTLRNRCIRTSK
jgi:2-keto-4-pentenoate hydratase/2-oxohepta-3-ene-1,7-dioic acid hydratase in catechol pathway